MVLDEACCRLLYQDVAVGDEDKAKLRMAVLLPSLDLQSTPECLVVNVDVRAAAEGIRLGKLISNIARRLTGSVAIAEYCFNKIVYAHGWCDCLSYCCGDPKLTEDIVLNGHKRSGTVNLVSALHHFRSTADGKPVMLWIDAVCINQEDTREKAATIALLDAIFEVAPIVHMWLGPDESLEPGLELLESSVGSSSPVAGFFEDATDTLEVLYTLPYWTRKWIVQEICLARIVVLHAGRQTTTSMDRSTLAAYMNRLFHHLRTRVRVDSLSPASFLLV